MCLRPAHLVVQVEEVLQARERLARGLSGGNVGIWQGDAVALGQREHELRLQRALYVKVQLRLGQAGDESL